jgi:glycosyltransferase involved in cell wall biosynthesis
MNSKTICIFNGLFLPHLGGVETYVYNFATSLVKLGHSVHVISYNTNKAPGTEIMNGIMVYRLPCFNLVNTRFPIPKYNPTYFRLLKIIKSLKADYYIINMRFYASSIFGSRIAAMNGKKVYLIEHVTDYMRINNPFFDLIGRLYENFVSSYIRKRVDKSFAISQQCSKWLEHFGFKVDGIIHNGINHETINGKNFDFRQRIGISKDSRIICFAGRLIRDKGVQYLLEAFDKIKDIYTDLHLVIAGDGEMLEEFKRKYASVCRIHFTGHINHNEVYSLLKASQILVFPSFYPEGMPTILMEAALNDCSIITTLSGGTSEIVPNIDYGLIIEQQSVDSIVDALEKLLTNEVMRKEISANLKERVLRYFDWTKITKEFSDKYLE